MVYHDFEDNSYLLNNIVKVTKKMNLLSAAIVGVFIINLIFLIFFSYLLLSHSNGVDDKYIKYSIALSSVGLFLVLLFSFLKKKGDKYFLLMAEKSEEIAKNSERSLPANIKDAMRNFSKSSELRPMTGENGWIFYLSLFVLYIIWTILIKGSN